MPDTHRSSHPLTTYQPTLISILFTLSALNMFYLEFFTTTLVSISTYYQISFLERAKPKVREEY